MRAKIIKNPAFLLITALVFFCHNPAAEAVVRTIADGETVNMSIVEGGDDDNLNLPSLSTDFFTNGSFADFGSGADSITVTGAGGNFSAVEIHPNGVFRNFERVYLSENGSDFWSVGDNDARLEFIDARDGTDTLSVGNLIRNSGGIGAGRRYRNFERVTLSDDNNVWAITGNDSSLENIDALGGTDTLEKTLGDTGNDNSFNAADSSFSVSSLSMPAYGNYSGFEQVAVSTSDNDDTWVVSANDTTSGWQWINGLGGTGDTVAFGDGNHNAMSINSSDGFYRNFERVTLSDNDNIWTITENDRELSLIDALAGTADTVVFGDGNHSGDALTKYVNFRRATLSGGNNIWTVGSNDSDLEYVDALGGTDTIILGSTVQTSAQLHSSGGYRNFERASLSDNNDFWTVTDNDLNLESIDALGGTDTLETSITDSTGDGFFSIADSALSVNSLATDPDFAKYANFEQLAVSTTDGDDMWVASTESSRWQWVNAAGGTDTLALGEGSHSAEEIHSDGFYRNFERVTLSNAIDSWSVTDNDLELEFIDALGETDTLTFGEGSHSAEEIRSGGRYRNFERAILSDGNDIWTETDNDLNLESINALGGTDILEIMLKDTQGDSSYNASDVPPSADLLASPAYGNYVDFERIAIGITDGDDTWVANSNADFTTDWGWINARGGTDTLALGNGDHSSANVSAGGRYRNFERVTLSEEDNIWTFSAGDRNLESIDAFGGTDTIAFGNGSHNGEILSRFRNFERATLSDEDNTWFVGANDGDLEYIDAMNGNGSDTLVFGDGNHSSANVRADGLYRNFEQAVLSNADNMWTATDGDYNLDYIDALGGTDTLALEDRSGANISANGLYRNFEQVTLSDNDNTWTVTDDNRDLTRVDAMGGTDTLAFGDGNHSAMNINSSDGIYRNFERVTLSDNDNIWTVTEDDNSLESIDALGGTDTLEETLEDTNNDNSFNAADSSFSMSDLSTPAYGNYLNFEQVAVSTSDNDDTWVVSVNDTTSGWQWINGLDGTDTLAFGDGNHSAMNINSSDGLYRNFEQVTLSDNDNIWTVTENDRELSLVDALAGNDTIAFGDGNHDGEVLSRFRNFERATLSDEDNTWTVGANDGDLEYVDALGGSDTINVNAAAGTTRTLNGDDVGAGNLYRNFESLRKTGEGILSIERTVDLGMAGNLSVEQGNVSFNIVIEIPVSGDATAANSGKIISGSIHTTANSSIGVRGLSAYDLSRTANMSISIFEGDTSNIDDNTEITDPGLFTDIVREDNGLRVAFDSSEGARQEIAAAFNGANPRELAATIHTSLVAGRVDEGSSRIVEDIDSGLTSEAGVRELIPSEHGGVDYEIIDLQRKFFGSIEERVVEAVKLMLWETQQPTPTYRIFGGGFEKTSSGDLYEIGARGFSAGVHRLLFNERMGVGIAGAASFIETRGERVTEKTEGFHGAIYTRYDHGTVSATGIFSAGTHDYESERRAAAAGRINGKSDIFVYGAKVSAGLELLKNLPVRIKPEASFMFGRSSIDAYRETGGLGISLQKRETTSTEAGLKVNIAFNPLKTVLRTTVQPEIEGGIHYDFSADNEPVRASVFNTDYTIFRNGTEDKLRYSAGGKVIMSDNNHLSLKIGYEVEFREDMRSYTGSAQFQVRF
ncbi:hypothetical protein [Candidatus Mycalebacterium sp.]